MMKREWKIKGDDDDDKGKNEEQGWVMETWKMETRLRIGNEVTDFLLKPESLSSPSMTTLHNLFFLLFFFYRAQFSFFGSKTLRI